MDDKNEANVSIRNYERSIATETAAVGAYLKEMAITYTTTVSIDSWRKNEDFDHTPSTPNDIS
jgi:hypothetical protein